MYNFIRKNEPIPLPLAINFLICKSPGWVRKILVWIMTCPLTPFVYTPRGASIIRGLKNTNLSKMYDKEWDS